MTKLPQKKPTTRRTQSVRDARTPKLSENEIADLIKKKIPASVLESEKCKVTDIATMAVSLIPHLGNLNWPRTDFDECELEEEDAGDRGDFSRAAEAAVEIIAACEYFKKQYCAKLNEKRKDEHDFLNRDSPDFSTISFADVLKELYPKSDGFLHRQKRFLNVLEKAHSKKQLWSYIQHLGLSHEEVNQADLPNLVYNKISEGNILRIQLSNYKILAENFGDLRKHRKKLPAASISPKLPVRV